MGHSTATLHRVGDITPPIYLQAGRTKMDVSSKNNGGTVVLEHLANEAVSTEAGTWTVDATYATDQNATAVTGTVGFMYRLRCSVAPSAGKGLQATIDLHGAN